MIDVAEKIEPMDVQRLYTPGPWISSGYANQVLSRGAWNTVCLFWELKNGEVRNFNAANEDGTKAEDFRANARLIAAAPELLEATL